MNGNEYVVFEGFGTRDPVTTQPHQDEITANWADALVDEVFNDPDCERLQVASIIYAIREMGFPDAYATKVLKLEQLLDPKKEGLIVDKPRLRQVVEQWLRSCNEEKEADNSFEANINVTGIVHPNVDANSSVDIQLKKDDFYKNEISSLHSNLNASEDKIKTLQLEIGRLKKSVKILQTALQEAEEDKALAEESKTTVEEVLRGEKSRRNREVSALEKHLALAKDQIKILTKENDELCTNNLGFKCSINDLRDELVTKCYELKELVQEKAILETSFEQQQERLMQAEKEISRLENANLELMEHAKEWKKKIHDLKAEKDVLSKKFLVLSSRVKKGEDTSHSNSDFGSDSSNIAELSIFSPDFFSSPVASEKLSAELVESQIRETTTMESTKRISRLTNKATDGTALKQSVMRKRKLFDGAEMELENQKRCRAFNAQQTLPTMGPFQTVALPLERPTSFAINLTLRQKLCEALRRTLCIHPHLFGCIRDFLASQISNSITTGSEQLEVDLISLFYKFCTTQLNTPFQGREFLRVNGEEMPTQRGSSALRGNPSNKFCNEPLDNADTAINVYHSSHLLQLESNVSAEVQRLMLPSPDSNGKGCSTETHPENVFTDNAVKESFPTFQVCASGLKTGLPCGNLLQKTSSFAGNEIVEITKCSDPADINADGLNNVMLLPNETMEFNYHTLHPELCSSGFSGDIIDLMLPTATGNENSDESEQEAPDPLVCADALFPVVLGSRPECNNDNPEVDIVENKDFHVSDNNMLPNEASFNYNGSFEMINDSSPTLCTVSAMNVEELGAGISTENSDESNLEFQTAQSSLIKPFLELPYDSNFDPLDSTDSDFESFDSTSVQNNDSHDLQHSDDRPPSPPDPTDNCVNLSVRSGPYRCVILMLKLSLLIFVFLLFVCIILAKTIKDEEYINFLLALGGKYHQAEYPLY